MDIERGAVRRAFAPAAASAVASATEPVDFLVKLMLEWVSVNCA